MAPTRKRKSDSSSTDKENKKVSKQSSSSEKATKRASVERRPPSPDPEEFDDDTYRYLIHLEETKFQISARSFLKQNTETPSPVAPRHRRIIVDWLVYAHGRLDLPQEILHLTVSIVDRMLEKKKVPLEELELLGIGAMFVASKFEKGIEVPNSMDYEQLSENFSKPDILRMEKTILSELEFEISAPSILFFSEHLFTFLSQNNRFFDEGNGKKLRILTKLLGELALMDSSLACIEKSKLASAAWVLTVTVVDEDQLNVGRRKIQKAIRQHLGAEKAEMREIVRKLARSVHRTFRQPKLTAIRQKYKSSKFGDASNKLLTEDILEEIREIGFEDDQ